MARPHHCLAIADPVDLTRAVVVIPTTTRSRDSRDLGRALHAIGVPSHVSDSAAGGLRDLVVAELALLPYALVVLHVDDDHGTTAASTAAETEALLARIRTVATAPVVVTRGHPASQPGLTQRLSRQRAQPTDPSTRPGDQAPVRGAAAMAADGPLRDGSDSPTDAVYDRLTLREQALLDRLRSSPGRTLSRSELLRAAWGATYYTDSTVTVTVARLRRRLAESGAPDRITTVTGRGYRWDA